jgi:sugar phosphate isomerase/epimerase
MNRRDFLKACVAAAVFAVPGLPRTARGAEDVARWGQTLDIMDTWFWASDDQIDVATQAALLKKLGYGGMALSWGSKHTERMAALREAGLETPGCYVVVSVDEPYPDHLKQTVELLNDTGGLVWLALTSTKHKPSDPAGDDAALAIVNQCADDCKAAGVPGVALYPHVSFWMEKVGDATRLAGKADRPDVGVQFNQFHWMAADGGKELRKTLEEAKPYLKGVSVNGSSADVPSILPLGEGDYDVLPILQTLVEIDYRGPVSHQGYSIKGNVPERLAAAKKAWDDLVARASRP